MAILPSITQSPYAQNYASIIGVPIQIPLFNVLMVGTAVGLLHASYLYPTATSTPQLKDLHNHIIPHYAAHWRMIGVQLGLPKGRLDIIEYDNCDKAEPCCDAVLE